MIASVHDRQGGAKTGILKASLLFVRAWFAARLNLAVENLTLRQQLAVLKRSGKRLKLHPRDRAFWTWLARFLVRLVFCAHHRLNWTRSSVGIAAVLRPYWRWKPRARKPGRPTIKPETGPGVAYQTAVLA
jgi:hypothetical protein